MLSYRKQLGKIGIAVNAAVSYKDFYSCPRSLLEAMRSMDAPVDGDWELVSDIYRDDFWTDEVQGVAWNGSHWIFSTNANQAKPDSEDKALYVFAPGENFGDDGWATRVKYHEVPHPITGTSESDCHWGQLTFHEGLLYVSHWWKDGPRKNRASAVIFESTGANLNYKDWIELERPTDLNGNPIKVEFQGINPWDGMFYSSFEGHFLKHDPRNGNLIGERLPLQIPYGSIQGACFTPNGHVYVASDDKYQGNENFHSIPYYSALNGHRFGVIPVRVEGVDTPELEGICYVDVHFDDGRRAQIHTPILDNPDVSLDNIYFKSYSTSTPEIV